MDSMSEADLIVVTDTGSSDGTVNKLRNRGAVVYEEKVEPWRFDTARNLSLSHVPEDVDVCVCTDLDEVFVKGWRQKLEDAWEDDASMGNYLYNWSLNPDGSPDTQFIYFKVHGRHCYIWNYPVHECLKYIGDKPEKKIFIDGMVLNHYPDPLKSRGSYLPLLKMGASEKPDDPRMSYYLGREYMYAEKWTECITELKRYLSLPNATWAEERCAAMRWIAKSYDKLGDTAQAYRWYHRAIAEAPHMREPYVECALMAYFQKDWITTFFMSESALRITAKSDCFINAGYAWNFTPHDLAAISCYNLGLKELAHFHAKCALSLSPKNERLKNNLSLIEKAL
jgi:tetratricopeptide (TPR) repeat protein